MQWFANSLSQLQGTHKYASLSLQFTILIMLRQTVNLLQGVVSDIPKLLPSVSKRAIEKISAVQVLLQNSLTLDSEDPSEVVAANNKLFELLDELKADTEVIQPCCY